MLRISASRARLTLNTGIVIAVTVILIIAFMLIEFRILPWGA